MACGPDPVASEVSCQRILRNRSPGISANKQPARIWTNLRFTRVRPALGDQFTHVGCQGLGELNRTAPKMDCHSVRLQDEIRNGKSIDAGQWLGINHDQCTSHTVGGGYLRCMQQPPGNRPALATLHCCYGSDAAACRHIERWHGFAFHCPDSEGADDLDSVWKLACGPGVHINLLALAEAATTLDQPLEKGGDALEASPGAGASAFGKSRAWGPGPQPAYHMPVDVRPQEVRVLGMIDACEKPLAPTFKSPQHRVTGGKCTSCDQQILEWSNSASLESGLQLVEHIVGELELAPGNALKDSAALVIRPQPVQSGPRIRRSCQRLKEGSQSGSAAVCLISKQCAEAAVEHAAWAYAALVQEIFDATDGAYMGHGLASALGADRLIDVGVLAQSPQLPAMGAVRLAGERPCIATFADRTFVPVSHGLPRLTAVRALLRRDRAANDAEHPTFALAAARSDAPTSLARHDRTFPADAAKIRIPIAGDPHNGAHTATPTTRSNWPSVAIWAPSAALAITANGEGATRPARGRAERAAAGAQHRLVLAKRHRSIEAA